MRTATVISLLAISTSTLRADDGEDQIPEIPRKEFPAASACRVVRVVECDTIVVMLAGKQTRVGLIGLSAPSEPPERDMARDFAANLLLRESVYLDTESGWPEKDASGRVWAYLYRAPDGLLVNLELVRRGYARISAAQPYQFDDAMRFYQARARTARKGIWAKGADGTDEAPGSKSGGKTPTSRPTVEKPQKSGEGRHEGGQNSDAKSGGQSRANPTSDGAVMVWITKTGKKYHREECEHLKNSKTQVSLEDAKAKGLEPCQSCEAPR
ncbi:MAG: thermonuclease family protein [Phycisphaerales bacterium]|nr:thermonuclease family protein [Phycisphaerales bacterium]